MSGFGPNGLREEIIAAADLTARGYEVFTPIVGHSGSCDLLALCSASGVVIRVEVKRCVFRGQRADGSGVSYANKPNPDRASKHDVVAYVLVREQNAVEYVPALADAIARGA